MVEDYIKRMWEILTTFTKEAQNAALAKCKELNFDPDRGEISLDESLINLNAANLILTDAIEKQKLIQFPITVQKTVLSNLESTSRFLTGLINGKDEVVNLVNTIESLNIALWQYGFHNLSEEILGYQTKLNQLKKLDLETKQLKNELENGLNIKSELIQLLNEIKQAIGTIQTQVVTVEENAKNTIEKEVQTSEIAQKSVETLLSIQQKEKEANTSVSTVETLKEKIDAWAKEIKELADKSENIKEGLDNREKKLNSLITTAENTHKSVEDLLPGATSAGLASAFKQRKLENAKSKEKYMFGFVGSILVLCGLVIWMMQTVFVSPKENIEWWKILLQKIPVTFPFIWLGWFFARNFGHLVRLEEDYAFKESISRSFEGYKKQMQEVDPEKALPQLCNSTICILSEPPLRVFDRKTSDETPANSFLERFMPKAKNDKKEP